MLQADSPADLVAPEADAGDALARDGARTPEEIMELAKVIGEVVDDGTVFRGLGFSVVHRDRGTYDLTFDPPFAIPPVIVVSPPVAGPLTG